MTYKGDPIAEKLDKLAELTGVPGLRRRSEAASARGPIRFRVVPGILLALAAGGLALQIAYPWGFGLWMIIVPWFVTTMVYQFGPLGQRRGRKWDEREAAVVRHGHFIGLLTIAFGAIGAMLRLWHLWAPRNGLDWMAVTFFLLVLEANVAVLAASSAIPDALDDEEE